MHLAQAAGLQARRVVGSGAHHRQDPGLANDVVIELLGRLEVKVRARGFAQLYAWLDGADGLIVRADRQPPLVVVELARLLALLTGDRGPRLVQKVDRGEQRPGGGRAAEHVDLNRPNGGTGRGGVTGRQTRI